MKDIKTILLTVGIGSAMALFLTKPAARENIVRAGKKLKKVIRGDHYSWEDDNKMHYI
jgi:hypothetical protein